MAGWFYDYQLLQKCRSYGETRPADLTPVFLWLTLTSIFYLCKRCQVLYGPKSRVISEWMTGFISSTGCFYLNPCG